MQASIRSRSGIREVAVESVSDGRDELILKLSILEAEVLGLRQSLADVKANRDELRKEIDDLRRDRDHWRKLAEPSKPKLDTARQKTWFCGRASAGARV
jgi:chromosome segregation ATPase